MKLSWKMTEEKIRADWNLWMKVINSCWGLSYGLHSYQNYDWSWADHRSHADLCPVILA